MAENTKEQTPREQIMEHLCQLMGRGFAEAMVDDYAATLRQQAFSQFANPEALADWLDALHECHADGSVGNRKWEAAQVAARAIRSLNEPSGNSGQLRQQAARVDEGTAKLLRDVRAIYIGAERPMGDGCDSETWDRIEAALSAQPAERQGDVETELSAWLQKEMPPGTVISNPAWWAKRIAGRVHLIRPAQPSPLLAKYQSCGCIVCTCEDEEQCQGCGAQHCGTHPVGQIPNPAYAQFTHPAAPVTVPDGCVDSMLYAAAILEQSKSALDRREGAALRGHANALAAAPSQRAEVK